MELSEAKERVKDLINTSAMGIILHPNDKNLFSRDKEALETVLKALDNSISKDELRKVLERENNQYNETVNDVYKNPTNALVDFQRVCGKREVLKELLGE